MNIITYTDEKYNSKTFYNALLMQWEAMPYAELAVLISWLKTTYQIHQVHHWQSSSDPFYGDHLLYQRLYEKTLEMIDRVAEKTVAMGTVDLVNPILSSRQVSMIVEAAYFVRPGIPQPTDLATRSLNVTKLCLEVILMATESLKNKNQLTKGVDNMLSDLADEIENEIYLLKQRCTITSL